MQKGRFLPVEADTVVGETRYKETRAFARGLQREGLLLLRGRYVPGCQGSCQEAVVLGRERQVGPSYVGPWRAL